MLMTSERWQNAIQNPKFITTENFVQNLSNAYHKHQQKNKEISKMAITEKWKKSLPQPQYSNGTRTTATFLQISNKRFDWNVSYFSRRKNNS